MRKLIPDFVAAVVVLGLVGSLSAADQDSLSKDDQQALRTACAGYVQAVNSGDVGAVVKFWADDADYVNDSGEKFKGRTALEKLFKDNAPPPGRKFAFETQSLKQIVPGVVQEDGIGRFNGGDTDEEHVASRYSAIWIKSGNQWLISSVRDLGDLPATGETASPLKQLQWMVGDWRSTDNDTDVNMSCDYALDNKFLKLRYDIKTKQGESFTVVTMVTWDPAQQQLRSWFFDSRGGFGDGSWTRDGNSWSIAANGVVADGRRGTMTNIWKYTDDNTVTWQSKDRELDGIPMPESEVKFVRKTDAVSSK